MASFAQQDQHVALWHGANKQREIVSETLSRMIEVSSGLAPTAPIRSNLVNIHSQFTRIQVYIMNVVIQYDHLICTLTNDRITCISNFQSWLPKLRTAYCSC